MDDFLLPDELFFVCPKSALAGGSDDDFLDAVPQFERVLIDGPGFCMAAFTDADLAERHIGRQGERGQSLVVCGQAGLESITVLLELFDAIEINFVAIDPEPHHVAYATVTSLIETAKRRLKG
jgi:hypothetical protein